MHIYKKKEREMKAKVEENNKRLDKLQQALHAEKNRFHYAEVSLHDGTRNPDAPVY
jgi:ABC-type Fe3+-citrate transport system substrate-binding protein